MRNRPFATISIEPCPKGERLRRWSVLTLTVSAAALIAGLLGYMALANAAETVQTNCAGGRGYSNCRTTYSNDNGPIVTQAEADPEMARRDALWWKRCEPKIVTGEYGVTRYVYNGKRGCSNGQWQDD